MAGRGQPWSAVVGCDRLWSAVVSRVTVVCRKQYYSRRVAHDLTGRPRPNQAAYLHAFNMKLTCPVADELNTRGRQVYAPEQTTRSFGILSEHPITSVSYTPVNLSCLDMSMGVAGAKYSQSWTLRTFVAQYKFMRSQYRDLGTAIYRTIVF